MSDQVKLVAGRQAWVEIDGQTVRADVLSFSPRKAMVLLRAQENTAEVEGVKPDLKLFCCGQKRNCEVRKIRVIEVL